MSLTVFAASSLTDAFAAIGAAFTTANPGVAVRFNFAGSGALRQQLEQGAAADLFASADETQMRLAVAAGLIQGTPTNFAKNHLVIITPAGNPGRIADLTDLARPGVKLVLAGAGVPAGAYARTMLQQISGDFAGRALANVRSEETSVRAVVTKVQLGEADAGIVYASDVTPAVAGRLEVIAIPASANVVASYPIGLLQRSRQQQAGATFISFVRSEAGQSILSRHGFLVDAATGGRAAAP